MKTGGKLHTSVVPFVDTVINCTTLGIFLIRFKRTTTVGILVTFIADLYRELPLIIKNLDKMISWGKTLTNLSIPSVIYIHTKIWINSLILLYATPKIGKSPNNKNPPQKIPIRKKFFIFHFLFLHTKIQNHIADDYGQSAPSRSFSSKVNDDNIW